MKIAKETENLLIIKESNIIGPMIGGIFIFVGVILFIVSVFLINISELLGYLKFCGGFMAIIGIFAAILLYEETTIVADKTDKVLKVIKRKSYSSRKSFLDIGGIEKIGYREKTDNSDGSTYYYVELDAFTKQSVQIPLVRTPRIGGTIAEKFMAENREAAKKLSKFLGVVLSSE